MGGDLGHKGEALTNRISALLKGTPESSLALLLYEDTERRQLSLSQGVGSYQTRICQHLDLGFPSFRDCEK